MPTRQGAMLAKRISIWDRDSRSRSTMAPRSSRPTRWKVFLPMSTPSVAMAVDLALAMRIMGWAPCSCLPPQQGRWGARPDHPIRRSGEAADRKAPPHPLTIISHGAQREATATDACIAALSVDELPERYSRTAGPAIWRPGMLVEVMVVAAVP